MGDAEQPGAEARRVVEFPYVLIGLQKNVLTQVERIVGIAGKPQQVIEDTLLPTRYEEVEGLHIALANACNQVRVFDGPKDQTLSPWIKTHGAGKKSVRSGRLITLYRDCSGNPLFHYGNRHRAGGADA